MQLTAKEIINETVEFYKNNFRSFGHNEDEEVRCLYNGPNGEKCAFSRCCTNDSEFMEGSGADAQIGVAKFLPQYEGQPKEFWNNLQTLHDSDDYWSGNKLTQAGINYVSFLKDHYS